MKINNILKNSLYVPISKNYKNNFNCLNSYDTFVPSFSSKVECSRNQDSTAISEYEKLKICIAKIREQKQFASFLNKKGKVSMEEYNDILKNSPFIIDKAYEYLISQQKVECGCEDIAKLAINAKHYFDNSEKINGRKYRIISIGTSPSPLTEAMQNLGCEVIFLPISGINSLSSRKDISESENLKLALDYLDSKGVNGKDNNGVLNIVLDYAFSRKTLDTISSLISQVNNVDFKDDILPMSLSELFYCLFFEHKIEPIFDYPLMEKSALCAQYNNDLLYSYEADVSNVPHFYLYDEMMKTSSYTVTSKLKTKSVLFNSFETFSKPLARAFSLCTIHEMMNLKKQKEF